MEVPTVYVQEPKGSYEAWAALARLLAQIQSVFYLITVATDSQVTRDEEETIHEIYHAASLGHELSEEADRRAHMLHHLAQVPLADKNATQGKED